MKKILALCALLGFACLFGIPASASDLKISGSYYAAGYYDNNHSLAKNSGASSSFYAQRLRMQPVIEVAEGLTLTARFDAMERVWGKESLSDAQGSEKNIQWERAYVTFMTSLGEFDVGWQRGHNTWGTTFCDSTNSYPRIKFTTKLGNWYLIAVTEKYSEGDIGTDKADADKDHYMLATIYRWNSGNAGLLWKYVNYSNYSDSSDNPLNLYYAYGMPGYKQKFHIVSPYFKTNLGPVYLEGQFYYIFGDYLKYETFTAAPYNKNVDIEGLSIYFKGKIDLGPSYVGGIFAYISGDDASTPYKFESGVGGGEDWDPCLILWNDNLHQWMGNLGSVNYGAPKPDMSGYDGDQFGNGFLYQIFAGFRPIEKFDIMASYTIAYADSTQIATLPVYIKDRNQYKTYIDDSYGSELDITGTYKIYENLSYMVGFGYLWTGDYFKGDDATAEIDDDYLIINKLTLTF